MRVLLIEDDTVLGDGLSIGLGQMGYTVDWLDHGDLAVDALKADSFDAVILDLALPGRDGLSLLRHWRGDGSHLPVLVLSGYDDIDTRVAGLDAGADDYVVKPISLDELAARLRALSRRNLGYQDNELVFGGIRLDRTTGDVTRGGRALHLSLRERTLLETMLERPEHTFSRDYLASRLYGWEGGPESNSLEVHICHLRNKLGHGFIRTVRGLGYRLTGPCIVTYSLSARLLVLLLGLLGLIWLALSYYIQAEARRTAAADIDARLHRAAELVLASSRHRLDSATPTSTGVYATSDSDRQSPEFEVTTRDGRVLLRSLRFPRAVGNPRPVRGYTTRQVDGTTWRVFTMVDRASGLICRVGVDDIAQEVRRASLLDRFSRPVLLALPPLALFAWASIWLGLRPLRALTRELERRDALELEPLPAGRRRLPTEIALLTVTLNRLLARLRNTLATQRAFVSAAGHELRTPIAGLKTQIEVAQRARDAGERDHALIRLAESTTRMQQLVHKLVLLARLDPAAPALRRQPVYVADALRRAVAARLGDAEHAALRLEIETHDAWVVGDTELLESLTGNLIDNARRFAPTNSTITLSLAARERMLVMTGTDHGPGIPADERERVFEPFYRVNPGVRDGTGLGLTLSRAIAAAHGGEVWIEAPSQGGTQVVVRLPITRA